MSSRYIARRYGGGESRAASVVRDSSWSRASSQVPELITSGYSSRVTSRAGTPIGDGERPWSSASTYNYYQKQTNPAGGRASRAVSARPSTPELGSSRVPWADYSVRHVAPSMNGYTEALMKSSRKLRERSFSPTREHVTTVRNVPAYQSNMDFYRGKVKSIYEREPMFSEFVRNLPLTDLHAFNSRDLCRLKKDFQDMIEDNWDRKQCNDPSVPHDIAYKASSWNNYLGKEVPASVTLAEKHRQRGHFFVPPPRIFVYHRSTQGPRQLF